MYGNVFKHIVDQWNVANFPKKPRGYIFKGLPWGTYKGELDRREICVSKSAGFQGKGSKSQQAIFNEQMIILRVGTSDTTVKLEYIFYH